MKDKKRVSIVNAFETILGNLKRKPNKIWVDQGHEFYNSQFKKFFKESNIQMYSICNERKYVVAETIFKTLKNRIYKHMADVSKNVYFDVLDDDTGCTPSWSQEVSAISKIKIQFHGLMLLMTQMVKRLFEHFMKKNCKRLIKKKLD